MNFEEFKTYRQRILDYLLIISSAEEQRSYQKSVFHVNVPDEFLCMWFDDLAIPESLKLGSAVLTNSEVDALNTFSEKLNSAGFLIRKPKQITLEELLNNQEWQDIIAEASSLLSKLSRRSD